MTVYAWEDALQLTEEEYDAQPQTIDPWEIEAERDAILEAEYAAWCATFERPYTDAELVEMARQAGEE